MCKLLISRRRYSSFSLCDPPRPSPAENFLYLTRGHKIYRGRQEGLFQNVSASHNICGMSSASRLEASVVGYWRDLPYAIPHHKPMSCSVGRSSASLCNSSQREKFVSQPNESKPIMKNISRKGSRRLDVAGNVDYQLYRERGACYGMGWLATEWGGIAGSRQAPRVSASQGKTRRTWNPVF